MQKDTHIEDPSVLAINIRWQFSKAINKRKGLICDIFNRFSAMYRGKKIDEVHWTQKMRCHLHQAMWPKLELHCNLKDVPEKQLHHAHWLFPSQWGFRKGAIFRKMTHTNSYAIWEGTEHEIDITHWIKPQKFLISKGNDLQKTRMEDKENQVCIRQVEKRKI